LARPAALERRLGHHFANGALLEQALTHRGHGAQNNERLEFLGDGVLGCAVAEELYARFPQLPEGKLTRLRASVVREEALAEVAEDLNLAKHVRFAEAEFPGGIPPRGSIVADALEAVFGAIFLDAGYEAARKAVLLAFRPLMERLDPEQSVKDPKTELQEILQSRRQRLPEYRVLAVRGAAHRQSFEVECIVAEAGLSAAGRGTSRQRAEQEAAAAMLEKLAG
jgi:ribonuclease-3